MATFFMVTFYKENTAANFRFLLIERKYRLSEVVIRDVGLKALVYCWLCCV
jgi:hypothetical protein